MKKLRDLLLNGLLTLIEKILYQFFSEIEVCEMEEEHKRNKRLKKSFYDPKLGNPFINIGDHVETTRKSMKYMSEKYRKADAECYYHSGIVKNISNRSTFGRLISFISEQDGILQEIFEHYLQLSKKNKEITNYTIDDFLK